MASSGRWWAGIEEWNQREISQATPHHVCPHTLKNIQQLGSAAEGLIQVPGGVGWIVTIRMRQVIPRAAEGDPGLFRVDQGTLLHGGKHIHHRGGHLIHIQDKNAAEQLGANEILKQRKPVDEGVDTDLPVRVTSDGYHFIRGYRG
jgi:hypothetical protein